MKSPLRRIVGRTKPKSDKEFSEQLQKDLEKSRVKKAMRESLTNFAEKHSNLLSGDVPIEDHYTAYSQQDYKHKVSFGTFVKFVTNYR